MRTVAGSDVAQPTGTLFDLTDRVIIKVANAADSLTDLTEFAVSLEYDQGTDELADAATLVFRRLEGVNSLAPLMTGSPPIDVGRRVTIAVNPGGGTYREVFRGRIDVVDWPDRHGDVTVACRDQAGRPADTWIETARELDGLAPGVALETVMQSVIDIHLAGVVSPLPTLYVPVATGAVVLHAPGDPAYAPFDQYVIDALRALAESIGWTVRWRNFDASASDWKWTLFQPARTKVVADYTFGTDDYWDVTTMRQDVTDIRNVVEVEYIGAGETLESVQYPAELDVATDPSVVKYGRRYMKIAEGTDSPINNATLALAMATAAYNDLSEPDALVEITGRYFWPGEIGVDLYTFTANNIHFSSNQTLAAMRFHHRIAVNERPTTKILCRGNPSGGVLMWMRKASRTGTTVPQTADIIRVSSTESSDGTTRDFTITIGPRCDTVHVWYRTVPLAVTGDALDFSGSETVTEVPTHTILPRVAGTDLLTFSIPHPAAGYRVAGRLIPYTEPDPDPVEGASWPFFVYPSPLPAVAQGSVSIESNGSWNATVDGGSEALSFRWSFSTSAFPADATVTASGTLVTGTGRLLAMTGAALTFGQTLYITIVPFDAVSGGGNALPAIHLRAAYQTFTANKTTTYDPSNWSLQVLSVAGAVNDYTISQVATTDGWPQNVALTAPAGTDFSMFPTLPAGVTITSCEADVYDNRHFTSLFFFGIIRHESTSSTQIGTDSATIGGGSQTLSAALSETTSTGRTYRVYASIQAGFSNEAAGNFRIGPVRIVYTQANPSTSV